MIAIGHCGRHILGTRKHVCVCAMNSRVSREPFTGPDTTMGKSFLMANAFIIQRTHAQ